jgi:hypothetical protein
MHNKKMGKSIYFTTINVAGSFKLGKKAFIALKGGTVGASALQQLEAKAQAVPVRRQIVQYVIGGAGARADGHSRPPTLDRLDTPLASAPPVYTYDSRSVI